MARVLLLDDDTDFAELVKLSLNDAGHEVDVRSNGTDARLCLAQREYDLLIADIFIKSDGRFVADGGLLLIGRVRNATGDPWSGTRKRLPIIAISGAAHVPGNEFVLEQARTVGADATLQKPFTPEELLAIVDRLTGAP